MRHSKLNIPTQIPNILLVAGNGRNVGKTYFVCKLIEHLVQTTPVTGVKVSSHFHPYNETDVLIKNKHFVILEEKQLTNKDSSLMLQAGAGKVYFVMAEQEHLEEAFGQLYPLLPQHPVVCESGGLHQIINPGLFFFVTPPLQKIIKPRHLDYKPIMVYNTGHSLNFKIEEISFVNNRFRISNQTIQPKPAD